MTDNVYTQQHTVTTMHTKDILTYHRQGGNRGRHISLNQLAISARLDSDVAYLLDGEMAASGTKRNALLNLAARWYITELDEARRAHAHGGTGVDGTMSTSHERLLTGTLTASELSKLHHIAASLNISVDELVERLVHKLLDEYDDKPFAYL